MSASRRILRAQARAEAKLSQLRRGTLCLVCERTPASKVALFRPYGYLAELARKRGKRPAQHVIKAPLCPACTTDRASVEAAVIDQLDPA